MESIILDDFFLLFFLKTNPTCDFLKIEFNEALLQLSFQRTKSISENKNSIQKTEQKLALCFHSKLFLAGGGRVLKKFQPSLPIK